MSDRRGAISLRALAFILWAIGLVWFASPFLLQKSGLPFAGTPFPFADGQNAVRASDGTLYAGDAMYGRIQEYDASGRFVRGWFIPWAGGKPFVLRMVGETLHVALWMDRGALYDSLGRQLRLYDTTGSREINLVIETGPPGLYLDGAKVVAKDSSGALKTLAVLDDPLWFISPLFGFGLVVVGTLINFIARRRQ